MKSNDYKIELQNESSEYVLNLVLRCFDAHIKGLTVTLDCTNEIYDLIMNNEYFREQFGKRHIDIIITETADKNIYSNFPNARFVKFTNV